MLRNPEPPSGFVFNAAFAGHVRRAVEVNPSAHDGAVACGRPTGDEPYRCVGWSYRITATNEPVKAEANRGAAYNSAIALSMAPHVDCVCLFSRDRLEVFVGGDRLPVGEF